MMEITFLFIAYTPLPKKNFDRQKNGMIPFIFSFDDCSREFRITYSTRLLLHIIKNKNQRIVEIDSNISPYRKTLPHDKKTTYHEGEFFSYEHG